MTPPPRAAAQTAVRASQATRGGRAGGSDACSSPFIAPTRQVRLLVRYVPRTGARELPTQKCWPGSYGLFRRAPCDCPITSAMSIQSIGATGVNALYGTAPLTQTSPPPAPQLNGTLDGIAQQLSMAPDALLGALAQVQSISDLAQ